ncbi:MAG: M48 family metalloprotease [Xanthomonadaceae bacterium]|nr:M48 family metalloprotease [Xanthomonadaceae bacterium]
MNYFEAKRKLNRETFWLYVVFSLNILFSMSIAFGAAYWVEARYFEVPTLYSDGSYRFYSEVGLWAAALTLVVIMFNYGRAYFSNGDGSLLPLSMQAVDVSGNYDEADYRKLNQVVDEMAIATALPVPKLYVLPSGALNAFATGTNYHNSAVTVTTKALELPRDELSALIAHEVEHIKSLDMRFNLHMAAILAGFMAITSIGFHVIDGVLRARPRSGNKNQGQALIAGIAIGVGLIILGAFHYWIGKLLQSRISIRREYHADLNAVIAMRQAIPMVSLLRRLNKEDPLDSAIEGADAEYAHFFFSNPLTAKAFSFPTHPPLEERIKRVNSYVTEAEILAERSRKSQKNRRDSANESMNETTHDTNHEKATAEPAKTAHKTTPSGTDFLGKVVGTAIIHDAIQESVKESVNKGESPLKPNTRTWRDTALNQPTLEELMMLIPSEFLKVMSHKTGYILFALLLVSDDPTVREQQYSRLREAEVKYLDYLYKIYAEREIEYGYLLIEMLYSSLRDLDEAGSETLQRYFSSLTRDLSALTFQQWGMFYAIDGYLDRLLEYEEETLARPVRTRKKERVTELEKRDAYLLIAAFLTEAGEYDDDEKGIAFNAILQAIAPGESRYFPVINKAFWEDNLPYAFTVLNRLPEAEANRVLEALLTAVGMDDYLTLKEYQAMRLVALHLGELLPLSFHDWFNGKWQSEE